MDGMNQVEILAKNVRSQYLPVIAEKVLTLIELNGMAGYRKCTVKKLTESLASTDFIGLVTESLVDEALKNLESEGRVFHIVTELGRCYSLKPKIPSHYLDHPA